MTKKEKVSATLNGKKFNNYPNGLLTCHATAEYAGISIQEYSTDSAKLAKSVLAYYKKIKPDAVWISADTLITAEAMGLEIRFPSVDIPAQSSGKYIVKTIEDLERLPEPDPYRLGRMPVIINALKIVKEEIGDEVFIVGCFDQSPFSLACSLAGMENAMMWGLTDPDILRKLLEKCVELVIAYAKALADAGADMLSTGDSPSGLLDPAMYRLWGLEYEKRVFKELKKYTNAFLSLHICGNVFPILEDMTLSGADVLELDHPVLLREACKVVPDSIAIWGNIDPINTLYNGTVESVKAARQKAVEIVESFNRKRFILSSGCTVAPGTPVENIHAFTEKY